MRTIHTEIIIQTHCRIIWDILTEFRAYSEWNPFIREIKGSPEQGTRLTVAIQPLKQRSMNDPEVAKSIWLTHR